jgi:hypothetical protein
VQVAVQLAWSASLWFKASGAFQINLALSLETLDDVEKLPGVETVALTYVVRFGSDFGIELRPHRYKTGYRASDSKYGRHVHVHAEADLIPPSLVTPDSVSGCRM